MKSIQAAKAHHDTDSIQDIPDYLVYEVIDGKPIYYKGWQEVLNKTKTLEEIIASSGIQSYILYYLNIILFTKLGTNNFLFFSNESGVHIGHKKNLASDLAIYSKEILSAEKITTKYVDVPATVYVEVDIKADVEDMGETGYISLKTKKLLNFGAEKVIWILSKPKQVIVATEEKHWEVVNWDEDVALIEGHVFNIGKHLEKEGIDPDK